MRADDHIDQQCPFGPELARYWAVRRDVFSRWDQGVKVDREGLYTAKPEAVAGGIAALTPGNVVIDGTCGVGALTIALAARSKSVLAVDIDSSRLNLAQHNARLYGVENRIRFVHGDILEVLKSERADCVIFDPDWGGPGYHTVPSIKLRELNPDGERLITSGLRAARRV